MLRITPDADWTAQFFEHMRLTLPAYSAQELANTLTAAAYLRMEPGETHGARAWSQVRHMGHVHGLDVHIGFTSRPDENVDRIMTNLNMGTCWCLQADAFAWKFTPE